MKKKLKTTLPDLPGHGDVEVRIGDSVTLFKVPLTELNALMEGWSKRNYPHQTFGLGSLVELAIKQASGSAVSPGDRVRRFRKERKLTQVQLAELAGTTQANVASVESGSRVLGKELAEKLGKALGVDYRIFL